MCLSWVFFRARTFQGALEILEGLAGPWEMPLIDLPTMSHATLALAALIVVESLESRPGPLHARFMAWPAPLRIGVWYALLGAIVLFGVEGAGQFIYFQF